MVPPVGSVAATELIRRVVVKDVVGAEFSTVAAAELAAAQGRLDPVAGVMVQLVWLAAAAAGVAGRLLVVMHHLVVDGVSWRILVPDLAAAWAAGRRRAASRGWRRWGRRCGGGRTGWSRPRAPPERVAELELWRAMLAGPDPVLGTRRVDPAVDVGATVDTRQRGGFGAGDRGGADHGAGAVPRRCGRWLVDRVGGGVGVVAAGSGGCGGGCGDRGGGAWARGQVLAGADLSRTVGWFTTMFPVRLALAGIDLDDVLAGGAAAGAAVKAVKEQIRAVPDHGIGYGLLRYLNPDARRRIARDAFAAGRVQLPGPVRHRRPGRGGLDTGALGRWGEGAGERVLAADVAVDVNAAVVDTAAGPVLRAGFAFPTGVLTAAEVGELARRWSAALAGLARHVAAPDAGGLTPSDLPLVQLDQAAIEALEARYPGLREVWPLAPLQAGLLFHALLADRSVDAYLVQLVLELRGRLDPPRLRAAGQALLDRHANLRAGFVAAPGGGFVQVVADGVELPWAEADLSGLDAAVREEELERLLARDRATRFDLATAPLLRLMLITLGAGEYRLVLTNHHILLDGWSTPLLMQGTAGAIRR